MCDYYTKEESEADFMKPNGPIQNTDRELWREVIGDCYSPSIHVTQDGRIGINVGGTVIVRTLREWHASVRKDATEPNQPVPQWCVEAGSHCAHHAEGRAYKRQPYNERDTFAAIIARHAPQQPQREYDFAKKNTILRKIASHVPAKVWMAAKEKAGYGTEVCAADISDPTVDEKWLEFVAQKQQPQPASEPTQREVERFRAFREFHSDERGIASLACCDCVTAADHDRIVAELQSQLSASKEHHEFYRSKCSEYMGNEQKLHAAISQKDAELAELRAESNARRDALVQIGEERAAEWKRAERAEADYANAKEINQRLANDYAAANQRVKELEKRLNEGGA